MNRACAPSPRRGITPKFPTLSEDRRWTCPGDLWIWNFFPYFPVFDTLNAIRAGWWKYTLFTRFYLQAPMRHTPRGSYMYTYVHRELVMTMTFKWIVNSQNGEQCLWIVLSCSWHPVWKVFNIMWQTNSCLPLVLIDLTHLIYILNIIMGKGGILSIVLSVFFTGKFALSQSMQGFQ